VADRGYANATVGNLIEAEEASVYPNQIRYGDILRHYPPAVIANLAHVVNAWVFRNWESIRMGAGTSGD